MIGERRIIRGSALILATVMLLNVISCGTLLYPERRYKEPGALDPGVVVLDAIGLLFFVVPGIIAFGVDLATGAIYYPADEVGAVPSSLDPEEINVVWVDPEEMSRKKIEGIIARQTNREVDLTRDDLRVYELDQHGRFVQWDDSRLIPYASLAGSKL